MNVTFQPIVFDYITYTVIYIVNQIYYINLQRNCPLFTDDLLTINYSISNQRTENLSLPHRNRRSQNATNAQNITCKIVIICSGSQQETPTSIIDSVVYGLE